MQKKTFIVIILSSIIFFLLINTAYYWESWLGFVATLTTLFLILVFCILCLVLICQIVFAFKEKFIYSNRIILISVMAAVIGLTAYKPDGLVDFDSLAGSDALIARAEGSANCVMTLKLKSSKKFYQTNVCFGVEINSGKYFVTKDTIRFTNISNRNEDDYYEFAIIKPDKFSNNKKILGDLFLYKNVSDTSPRLLFITKNELIK